ADRLVGWVRENNRWRPDAEVVADTVRLAEANFPKADGFTLRLGGGLLKSGRPTLLTAQAGGFFVFELTPDQAAGANLRERGYVFRGHVHTADWRRAEPRVEL